MPPPGSQDRACGPPVPAQSTIASGRKLHSRLFSPMSAPICPVPTGKAPRRPARPLSPRPSASHPHQHPPRHQPRRPPTPWPAPPRTRTALALPSGHPLAPKGTPLCAQWRQRAPPQPSGGVPPASGSAPAMLPPAGRHLLAGPVCTPRLPKPQPRPAPPRLRPAGGQITDRAE